MRLIALISICLLAGCSDYDQLEVGIPPSVERYHPFLGGAVPLLWKIDGQDLRGKEEDLLFLGKQSSSNELLDFKLTTSGRVLSVGSFGPDSSGWIENYSKVRFPDGSTENRVLERIEFSASGEILSVNHAEELEYRLECDRSWSGKTLQRREWKGFIAADPSDRERAIRIEFPDRMIGNELLVEITLGEVLVERLSVHLNFGAELDLAKRLPAGRGLVRVRPEGSTGDVAWEERPFEVRDESKEVAIDWGADADAGD